MKHLLSWMLALALALLPSGGAAEEKPRRLTLMIYMCGSNLESTYGSATSDILEMLEAGGADCFVDTVEELLEVITE